MKIALILDSRDADFFVQANALNAFLQASQLTYCEAQLWLFYSENKPRELPQLACLLTIVRWINLPTGALTEQQLAVLMPLQQGFLGDVLLFGNDCNAAELATRLSYRLAGESYTGVKALQATGSGYAVKKAVYGQQMQLSVALSAGPYCLSVAAGGGPAPTAAFDGAQSDENLPVPPLAWRVAFEQQPREVQDALQRATCVLALGNGVKSVEQLRQLQALAQQWGAQVGVSRPVAMNGWCEISRMLGISGQSIRPEVCIAAGISGAAALMSGIQSSPFIVAINNDPQAAVFCQSDVGIVDDLQPVLAELLACVLTSSEAK